MKKYVVRYEVEGFIEKEEFNTYEEAEKFYDNALDKLGKWLLSIDLYEA